MRLTLSIDAIPHQIDSTDPDLLARWIVEIFGRIREIHEATLIQFQAYPSVLPQSVDGDWQPDWITDSRIIGQVIKIRSPRDLVAALSQQLDEVENLR